MKGRGKNLLLAIVFSTVIIVVVAAGYMLIDQTTLKRIFQLLGGNMPSGIIQFVTFVAFFWGIFEINERSHKVKYESQSFGLNLLPEQEQWVLSPEDVKDLKIKMIDYEKEHKFLMVDVIKKAATKFRANKSISDVMDIVSTQIRINMNRAESTQSVIRYLAWAIPSIGFIGTIMGIAQALGFADQVADSPENLSIVTSYMYVAFDTTLLSLLLSIIMMWFFHALQEKEEDLHTRMEEYVIDNLVNRIHVE